MLWYTVICKFTHLEIHPHSEVTSKHTSPPSMAATFLTTHLMAVLQLSGYSIFHGRRGFTTETLNIF